MARRRSVPRGLLLTPIFVALFEGAVAEQGAAAQDVKDVLLTMTREGQAPFRLTAADFAKLTRQQVKATDHEQNVVTFEGVLLRDVLQPLALPFGKKLRGKALTTYLLIEARDGYQVVFTLSELDSLFTDKIVLLADRRDGKPLTEKEGPLRVVVQTKSVRLAGFGKSNPSTHETLAQHPKRQRLHDSHQLVAPTLIVGCATLDSRVREDSDGNSLPI